MFETVNSGKATVGGPPTPSWISRPIFFFSSIEQMDLE